MLQRRLNDLKFWKRHPPNLLHFDDSHWRNASMRSSCKASSQFMVKWGGLFHCGWCHFWAGSPWFYWKASWASQGKQSSKQHPSMTSASAPASKFLPCVSSYTDFLWWWTTMWKCKLNKPFLSQLASWSWYFMQEYKPGVTKIRTHYFCVQDMSVY